MKEVIQQETSTDFLENELEQNAVPQNNKIMTYDGYNEPLEVISAPWIKELAELMISDPYIGVSNPKIKASIFYQEIKDTHILVVSYLNSLITMEPILKGFTLLITNIAVTSFNLEEADFTDSISGQLLKTVPEALAFSPSITKVVLSKNTGIANYAPKVVALFASSLVTTLILDGCSIKNCYETLKSAIASGIRCISLKNNLITAFWNPGEQAELELEKQKVIDLLNSHNQQNEDCLNALRTTNLLSDFIPKTLVEIVGGYTDEHMECYI